MRLCIIECHDAVAVFYGCMMISIFKLLLLLSSSSSSSSSSALELFTIRYVQYDLLHFHLLGRHELGEIAPVQQRE